MNEHTLVAYGFYCGELGRLGHACNHRTLLMEAEGSGVQGHLGL